MYLLAAKSSDCVSKVSFVVTPSSSVTLSGSNASAIAASVTAEGVPVYEPVPVATTLMYFLASSAVSL